MLFPQWGIRSVWDTWVISSPGLATILPFQPFALPSSPFLDSWNFYFMHFSTLVTPLLFVWQTGDREQEIALLFYEGVRFLGDAGVFGVQQFAHSSGGTMRLKSHVGNGTYKCNTNLKTKASFCNICRYLILFLFQIVVSTDRNDPECIRNIYLFLSSSQWPTLYLLWHKKGPPSDFVVSWQRSSETKLNCFLNQYSHPPLCIKA